MFSSKTEVGQSKGDRNAVVDGTGMSWQILVDHGVLRSFPPGVALLNQGEPLGEVDLIKKGAVKLVYINANGHSIIIGLYSQDQLLGVSEAVSEKPCQLSAITLTHTTICSIPLATFHRLLACNSQLEAQVLRQLSVNLLNLELWTALRLTQESGEFLQQFLLQLAPSSYLQNDPTGIRIITHLKHWEIAEFLGTTPAYFSRLLARLEVRGIVKRKNGRIYLLPTKSK
jgi:CRP/FNR family transcriptional regulator